MKKKGEGRSLEDKIMQLIAERLDTGGKLPTEQQMVKDFGVSRTTLRETLSMFEANGFIKSLRGSGRYATMPDFSGQIRDAWSVIIRANPYMMLELLEIRGLLEASTLPTAMERITIKQIEAMGRQVRAMKEKAARGEEYVEEDQLFHSILYESTGNALLEQLLTAFSDLYNASHIDLPPSNLEGVAAQHEDMLEALTRRDLEAMTKLLKQQFVDIRGRILVYLMNAEQDGKKIDKTSWADAKKTRKVRPA